MLEWAGSTRCSTQQEFKTIPLPTRACSAAPSKALAHPTCKRNAVPPALNRRHHHVGRVQRVDVVGREGGRLCHAVHDARIERRLLWQRMALTSQGHRGGRLFAAAIAACRWASARARPAGAVSHRRTPGGGGGGGVGG